MSPYLLERGEKKFLDPDLLKDPIQFCSDLIEFKLETDLMLQTSFDNNMAFQAARDQCFMTFMNKTPQTPQHLAYYTDRELKVGMKSCSDDEADRKL